MLTNFKILDDRVDKFSELVDTNLETLRRAVAENRDVYVSVINKSNLEQEERMNGLVDDLEKLATELYDIQVKLQNTDLNSGEETEKIARQLNDLEAHLNTSIITERSVRKQQDKQLAEEIDKIVTQLGTKAGKKAAEQEGAAIEQKTQLTEVSQDLAKQQEDLKTL